jgi:ectoine hydroxylase-related dioxygenase (phytanoyl-CoA dioxygenase family)
MGTLCRAPQIGDGHQVLHRDGNPVCTTLWLIDDMTSENGPTRIVPGTHRSSADPADELGGDAERTHPREIRLEGTAGQVVVFDGRLWHGGTARVGGGPRRVLIIQYMARQHVRDHPVHVPPAALARYTPAQRWLLHLDDPQLSENERTYPRTGALAPGYA